MLLLSTRTTCMEHQLSPDRSHLFDSNVPSPSITTGFAGSAAFLDSSRTPSVLDELAHEVRQPLSVIESLAYYLEITSPDEKTRAHLQRIQAMVLQANLILKRTCRLQTQVAAE